MSQNRLNGTKTVSPLGMPVQSQELSCPQETGLTAAQLDKAVEAQLLRAMANTPAANLVLNLVSKSDDLFHSHDALREKLARCEGQYVRHHRKIELEIERD